jgi:RNA polymerase sigma-70 factor (ECF subfamily)
MNEAWLLAAAKRGDEAAFARVVDPYRRELHAHCYRMLGSSHDAEDALQDAMLDAWRGLASFRGRSSLRSWLYTVTTNACLKQIRRRPKRVLPIDYGPAADPHDAHREPLAESVWIEPYQDEQLRYEERETVEQAFVAALQHLPARQRAVLILREVLGFSAREAAEILDATPPAIDSALQRARRTVQERLPEQSQQAALSSLDDERLRELVDGYINAWETADVDALVTLLAEDAALAMPPQRGVVYGAGGGRRLPGGASDERKRAVAGGADARKRPAGIRPLPLRRRRGRVPPRPHLRAHARGRPDQGNHGIPRARGIRELQPTRDARERRGAP